MQEFESGDFHDRGVKQLVVVREDGVARIAREEMLASASAPMSAAAAATAELAFVVGGYAIVSDRVDGPWAAGAPRLDDEGDPVVISTRAVDLPPELARWHGRKVALYSPTGAYCTATVRELRIVSLVTPHFGTREEWKHMSAHDKVMDAWGFSWGMAGPDGGRGARGLRAQARDLRARGRAAAAAHGRGRARSFAARRRAGKNARASVVEGAAEELARAGRPRLVGPREGGRPGHRRALGPADAAGDGERVPPRL
jgi:hypothetical protein